MIGGAKCWFLGGKKQQCTAIKRQREHSECFWCVCLSEDSWERCLSSICQQWLGLSEEVTGCWGWTNTAQCLLSAPAENTQSFSSGWEISSGLCLSWGVLRGLGWCRHLIVGQQQRCMWMCHSFFLHLFLKETSICVTVLCFAGCCGLGCQSVGVSWW